MDMQKIFGNLFSLSNPEKIIIEKAIDLDDKSNSFLDKHIDENIKILNSIADYESFLDLINRAKKTHTFRGLEKRIYQLASTSPILKAKLVEHFEKAIVEYGNSTTSTREKAVQKMIYSLANLGIGEIVFITPEGPSASAGGLSQVILGLTRALNTSGLSSTIICPLYEEDYKSIHKSAEYYIANGIYYGSTHLSLVKLGDVKIELGPTKDLSSNKIIEAGNSYTVDVYFAEYENLRFFFLRNANLAKKIYTEKSSKEFIKSCSFLSRGALEVLINNDFQVNPDCIVTNDWPSAIVPVLLKTDNVYSKSSKLQSVKTFHILHNCGRAYQGRLNIFDNNEDFWPIFKLHSDHFFGLADEDDPKLINLTKAAIFHTTNAVIAVSKPYAEELFSPYNSEGLQNCLKNKQDIVYGISNGVQVDYLRKSIWEHLYGEENNYSPKKFEKSIIDIKKSLKTAIQEKYNLNKEEDSILISMVGRLTEQKGIKLFIDSKNTYSGSMLEDLLKENKKIQFLFVGPLEKSSELAENFSSLISRLQQRYPDRINAQFDFVEHKQALQIQAASDLFLMPSRYEPGGITQLESLAFGTPVVARRVGGIIATLQDYYHNNKNGNSFLFYEYHASALYQSINMAIKVLANKDIKEKLVASCYNAHHDWNTRIKSYLAIFQKASGVLDDYGFGHLNGRNNLLSSLKPFKR